MEANHGLYSTEVELLTDTKQYQQLVGRPIYLSISRLHQMQPEIPQVKTRKRIDLHQTQ